MMVSRQVYKQQSIKSSRQKLADRLHRLLAPAIFVFYISALFSVLALWVPCLRLVPGQTYPYSQCNISLVLNRYLGLEIAGSAFLLLAVYYYYRNIRLLILYAILAAMICILAFHLYIPRVEKLVVRAPVFFEDIPPVSQPAEVGNSSASSLNYDE